MSDELDALEQELEAMRPCELPPDLQRRLGQSLAHTRPSNRPVALWWWGGLVAAAACLAIAAFAWHLRSVPGISPQGNPPERRDLAIAPTLGSYKLAFARSTDRFDALLDEEAARPLATTDGNSRTFRPFDLNSIP